jgi:short-subunit dehydrogenase
MAESIAYREQVAVVTGASSGIGEALARELARRGARVALVARRAARLERLAKEIEEAGGTASVHACDVSDPEAVARAAAEVRARWGPVDLLVNNAGTATHVLFQDQDLDDVAHMMRTNYLGAVAWTLQVLPAMRERGRGSIVNLSSFAGLVPQVDEAAYSASKAALTALSEVLGHELAREGIHVMAVHPVLVRTEMFTPEVMARMPKGAADTFIPPEAFVTELLAALERRERSVVIPRRYRWIPRLRALFPRLLGRALARNRLAAIAKVAE